MSDNPLNDRVDSPIATVEVISRTYAVMAPASAEAAEIAELVERMGERFDIVHEYLQMTTAAGLPGSVVIEYS